MRPPIIAIAILFALSGCETAQERMMKAMEKQIHETIQTDWHGSIPLDGLVEASELCQQYSDLEGCGTVQAQLQDIAVAFAICRTDERSGLCQAVVHVIGKHPIASILPKAVAIQLPDTPFYWNLPTTILEAQAGNFEYRKEVASRWWEIWRTLTLSCIALLFMAVTGWFGWSKWYEAKQKRATLLAIQRAERIEQEIIRRAQEEQARADAERKAKLAHETHIAEQQHLAAVKLAKQQAAEAAAKLAGEKAGAALLLKAIFTPSKPKRRKNATSSQ